MTNPKTAAEILYPTTGSFEHAFRADVIEAGGFRPLP